MTEKQKLILLKNFIKDNFPITDLFKVGFFTPEMKGDYEAQAKRICEYFGYKTVYEHGAREINAHITYGGLDSSFRPLHIDSNGKLKCAPFVETIESLYK